MIKRKNGHVSLSQIRIDYGVWTSANVERQQAKAQQTKAKSTDTLHGTVR